MDDRIALLGQNGNGKSTFIRLLSDRLKPREGRIRKTSKLRVGYFSQDQEEGLDYEATPFHHMASALGPTARRDQGARPARPLRLLARPCRPQGRPAVGRREDAAAAVAGHAQRPSPAAARRADQPPRHGCARLAGRRHQRLRRRRRAGEPRHASGEAGRRPALGGGRRQGHAVRRRHRRLPGQALARAQWRQERQGRQAGARARGGCGGAAARARACAKKEQRKQSADSRAKRAPLKKTLETLEKGIAKLNKQRGDSRPSWPRPRPTPTRRSTSPIYSARRSGWSARSLMPSTSGWWRRKPTKRPERAIRRRRGAWPPSARCSGGSPSPGRR